MAECVCVCAHAHKIELNLNQIKVQSLINLLIKLFTETTLFLTP